MWDKMETPTIVYDLDTSGGLMEQIQTLLAPPKSDDGEKRSRKPDKDARRSGRATNHDTCDSCREGGDLLCCDHCPAAFHLQCCNPPLSEEMLPPGDWMCHRCMVRRKKREQKKEQLNGLLERQVSKLSPSPSPSPAAELELGALRLDGGPGAGPGAAVAQARLLERRPGSRPGTPTSNASTDTATPSEQNDVDEDLLDVDADEAPGSEPESAPQHLKRPFELLIAAAMERNPTQFQLPNDLTCTTALPGTSKRRRKEETTGKNVKRPQHELDHNGLVPLPVKVCFSCGRSCRLAPLIQCDYCPLLFHMDCVDPPLTAMPTGRWMCPNHSEHIVLNQRNLTLSNRCQLFDQFQDRMSQHAVKLDFLQRVHRQNPPNRPGAHPHRTKTLKVPDAIKSQYQCPPCMVAPAGIRNGELICNGVPDPPHQHLPSQHLTSEAEQQEWLRDIIALQCSIVRHLSAKQMPSSYWDSEQAEKADIKPCVVAENNVLCSSDRTVSPEPRPLPCSTPIGPQGAPLLNSFGPSEERGCCGACSERPCESCRTANGLLEQPARSNGPLERGGSPGACAQGWPRPQTPPAPGPTLPNHTGGVTVKVESAGLSPCTNSDPGLTPQPHRTASGGQAAVLMSSSVSSPAVGTRALTPQRAPPRDDGPGRPGCPTPPLDGKVILRAVSPGTGSVPSATGDLSGCMKALIEGEGEIELSKLDEKFIKLLAWQRIQQLFSPKAAPTQGPRVSPPPSASSPPPQALHAEAQQKEVQARAVFYPLMGKGGGVNMCYRSLYIGTGADMDVCLTNYGHCNYVSGKHACIFYDENTKHYELLNYSEHGTTVDNVLYSCDFSEKTTPSPYSSMVSKVQSIIRRCKKRKQQQQQQQEEEEEEGAETGVTPPGGTMNCQPQGAAPSPCSCKASSSSLIGGSGAGWEGTALLHHGSYIKLGCLQFVFSITEFASKQPKEEELCSPGHDGTELSDRQHSLKLHQVPVLRSNSVP
ncbi:PHD finger protein 12-like [Megalops cyprinoides]|uniref:PHD finger protein 12-like n=1 Tax=Megalops cyprinoides TaxID=118141 RepID=UPI001864279F|nr:PHD finger protein 12-like [Megalops cyprinoides]